MLLEIGVALLLAKILGFAFEKLKQPAVIGEILTGIVVGPFIAGKLFGMEYLSPVTEGLGEMGIILLLFISGLEIGVDEIKTAGKKGLLTSLFDVSIAFLFGVIAGHILGYDIRTSIAIGNIMVATSVGITVRTLMEMHALHSKVGELILTVAVLDDVLGIVVLSITLGQGEPAMLMFKIFIFFLVFMAAVLIIRRMREIKIGIPRLMLTAAIAFAFIFSAVAVDLGLAAVTGAFFAGLIFSNLPQRRRIDDFMRQMGEVFLIPLFFIWVGASFDFNALGNMGKLVLLFIPMALMGKIIGCSAGAKVCGFRARDALAVGVGMMPRMEVALVVVTIEMSMKIFNDALAHQVLASTILLVIVSSLITPPLLKIVYRGESSEKQGS
ncbi:MAG TPA: cation:proton antiporter [Thermoplasmatales archaeon]|nr:cation:proton antiporter [Thermoplasmatales archaeon]